jgi:hypothetical protein
MEAEKRRLAAIFSGPWPPKPIPKPNPKYPMKFKQFLRLAFGGRLYAERLRLFRKYMLHEIQQAEHLKKLSQKAREIEAIDQRDKFIVELQRDGVDETTGVAHRPRIAAWRAWNRINQRVQAIKSRWDKEKRKKILELPKSEGSGVSKDEKCSLVSKKRKKVTGSYPRK